MGVASAHIAELDVYLQVLARLMYSSSVLAPSGKPSARRLLSGRQTLGFSKDPAQVTNASYDLTLWGQCPALVRVARFDSSEAERSVIQGSRYEILCEEHARRLQEYEAKAYKVEECTIRVTPQGGDAKIVEGWTFVYSGDGRDLSDGVFDLGIWLSQMGRT